MDCLYCGRRAPPSREHIISEWTGCRVSSREIACKRCNERFGSGPEAHLQEQAKLFCEVLPNLDPERATVWSAEIEGETRAVRVDYDKSHAQTVSPVHKTNPLTDGRKEITLFGTEEQAEQVKRDYARKQRKVSWEVVTPPGDREVTSLCRTNFGALYDSHSLTAIAKYAANYAHYACGRSELARALAAQAIDCLEGRLEASSIATPPPRLLSPDIRISPPDTTVILAPSECRRGYGVLVVLFGMLPYFVVSPPLSQSLEYRVGHVFRACVPRADPVPTLEFTFGEFELKCTSELERSRRIGIAAKIAMPIVTSLLRERAPRSKFWSRFNDEGGPR